MITIRATIELSRGNFLAPTLHTRGEKEKKIIWAASWRGLVQAWGRVGLTPGPALLISK